MPKAGETAGRFFYKGITHFFVGLYIKEICLAGLFFLGESQLHSCRATLMLKSSWLQRAMSKEMSPHCPKPFS